VKHGPNLQAERASAELILLGTGTCVPVRERSSSCYALRSERFTLLLDIGVGALRRMTEAGVDYRETDAVILSHFHPDHVSDLAALIFANLYTPGFRREKPLTILGPPGLRGFLEVLQQAYGRWVLEPEFPLEVLERPPGGLDLGPFRLETAAAQHAKSAWHISVETPGKKRLVYSGDTGYSEELIRLAQGCNLLLIECSFPSNQPVQGHLTPAEVGMIAAQAGCRRVVLTHFYPLFQEEDPVATVRRFFSGDITAGQDLMRLRL